MRTNKFNLVCYALIWLWCAGDSVLFAQSSAPTSSSNAVNLPPDHDVVFWAWRGNLELQQCGLCHFDAGNEFATRLSPLSRFNEVKSWLSKDKHAIARQRIEPVPEAEQAGYLAQLRSQLLGTKDQNVVVPDYWMGPSNALSAKICAQMNWSEKKDERYQQFQRNCLTCHGGFDALNQSQEFTLGNVNHPGIECNYCHQIDKQSKWVDLHSSVNAKAVWRTLSRQQKAELGMRDLVTADNQAKLCMDCHVGNLQKGMFVSHEMYAAGHPPLPAVELQTLINNLPPHWQNASEQTAHTVAVGALAAEKQWLQLLEQASRQPERWGDYALYDCGACHHELKVESKRQLVRAPGAPGRPRLIEWPHPAASAVMNVLNNEESFGQSFNQLQRAITQRPFGDRQAVAEAASQLSQAIDSVLSPLTSDKLPADFNRRLLVTLCEASAESLLDYQSARSINWTIRSLHAQQKFDPKVDRAVMQLGKAVGSEFVTEGLPKGQRDKIFPDFISRQLELQQAYDPDMFAQQLADLKATLLGK